MYLQEVQNARRQCTNQLNAMVNTGATMPKDPDPASLEQASAATLRYTRVLAENNLDIKTMWSDTDDVLRAVVDAGYDPNEFLVDDGPHLQFSSSGRQEGSLSFYSRYSRVVRQSLCDKDSDLRALVTSALQTGTGAALTTLATALAVPISVIAILAPIVAVLLVLGVDAFCGGEADES